MQNKHLSSQFDGDLSQACAQLLEMGGLVEMQIRRAVAILAQASLSLAEEIFTTEIRVDALEVAIDHTLSSVIARRQPAARDLRLLLAISKITTNLERAGDEAKKIARKIKFIVGNDNHAARTMPIGDLRLASNLAADLIHRALDAFARLDMQAAIAILKEDDLIDREFQGFVHKLVAYMMEDPRVIGAGLDLLFIAKAVERIGDHAKNIAEYVIYIIWGADVRHRPLAEIEAALQGNPANPPENLS
ncbi:MAG: phosphate signaling complex protein PhoU [Zoogloeaceae bacterium]|jgi:phosphate transport system protein|nr:phosphate signaling complex protein PhoU [Zoogloeaceae bacterium]